MLHGKPKKGLVFPTNSGRPESHANIHNRCWAPLKEATGVSFKFHALRHFHASMLIEDGANPKEIQAEMGHSSIKITFDIYGILFKDAASDKRRQERADRLAAAIK